MSTRQSEPTAEQEGKEIFEYSVFGSPNQKIGDFTQSKLSGWSQ